jgi:hypothetical protein
VHDARLLGSTRGRRAERQGAVHHLLPAAAVLTAVAELSARHGEQQRERRPSGAAARARRELVQHPVVQRASRGHGLARGAVGQWEWWDRGRAGLSEAGSECSARARRQPGRTPPGWVRCERSSCAVPGVCVCGSGLGFSYSDDDVVGLLRHSDFDSAAGRRGER